VVATSTVALTGISKHYGAVHALRSVDLEVSTGEVLGLVGENGAGKSTLIGVLSGNVRPDEGSMTLDGEPVPLGDSRKLSALGVSVVVQEQSLVDALRVYENIYLGHEDLFGGWGLSRRKRLRDNAEALLRDMHIEGVSADSVVADLSYPQRQFVEIAKAFAFAEHTSRPPFILLDEPTSALSEHEAELLFSLIDRWRERAAFIYVSHILLDVLRLSTRLLVLRDGRTIETLPNEGITDSRLHELMVGRQRSLDYYREDAQQGATSETVALELRGGGRAAEFADVDLTVRQGEIVGLAGVVGSGKSSLAAALAGADPLQTGELLVDGAVRKHWTVPQAVEAGVFYVPPERASDSLFGSLSVRSNISIGFLDLVSLKPFQLLRLAAERKRADSLAKRLNVKTPTLSTPIGELSGGNQQKAVFARWMARECRVLVLDDPTRGIDVGTREEIYSLIRDLAGQGVGIVLCTESLEEIIGLSDRIVVMRDGRVVGEIPAPASAKPTEVDVVKYMM
jgi:ribose transport system ATP-binding protein